MGLSRLVLVGGLAVVAFVVALFALQDAPFSECHAEAVPDSSYKVAIQPRIGSFIVYGFDWSKASAVSMPPSVDFTRYRLTVTQNGQPVSGAEVCVRADRGGSRSFNGVAIGGGHETSPGEYDVGIQFGEPGRWNAHALIRRPGGSPVDVPFSVQAE